MPEECEPFLKEFLQRLRTLEELGDTLERLERFQQQYGRSAGVEILKRETGRNLSSLEAEMADRVNGIAECNRRGGGEIPEW